LFPALGVPDGLNIRQATFAAEYVAHHGNGTKAAIAAGYSPKGAHVRASQLLRLGKVKKRIERLTRRHEVTAERVLTRLDNLSLKAEESGNFPAAVKAEELLGKALGLFVDRSVSVNVDLNGSHLEAIRALAARRSNPDSDAGDDARLIEGEATEADSGNAVESYNRYYDKSASRASKCRKSVIDQGDGQVSDDSLSANKPRNDASTDREDNI
jgi:hypothetical protein